MNFAAGEPYDVLGHLRPADLHAGAARELDALVRDLRRRRARQPRALRRARRARDRGASGLRRCAPPGLPDRRGLRQAHGRLRGQRLDRVPIGGDRTAHLRAYRIGRKQTRPGIDRFCLSDGRGVRVGYSTKRFRKRLGRPARRYSREQGADRAHLEPELPRPRDPGRHARLGGAAADRRTADQDRLEPLVREEGRKGGTGGLQGEAGPGPRDRPREQALHLEPGEDAPHARRLEAGLAQVSRPGCVQPPDRNAVRHGGHKSCTGAERSGAGVALPGASSVGALRSSA